MMTRRDAHPHNLRLAVAIAEWDTALAHLQVLAAFGHGPTGRTRAAIDREFVSLCRVWRTAVHEQFDTTQIPTIVAEARAYATEHQAEIDELLQRKEVDT